MDNLENVSVIKKANIYFDGNVTSRTVLFADGKRKTLGIMLPGEYEFGTGDKEHMELLAGSIEILLPHSKSWLSIEPGQPFDVPAHSKFSLVVKEVSDYCCSYLKE